MNGKTANMIFTVSYDGKGFYGWQTQEGRRTVQSTIERGFEKALKLEAGSVSINGSGRTDSGVHAFAQVFSARLPVHMTPEKLAWIVNRVLPDDVFIEDASFADDSFHARYSARYKTYRYVIYRSKRRNPLVSDYAWNYPYEFDLEKLRKVKEIFIGTHDFKGLMSQKSSAKTTVRTIYDISVDVRNAASFRGDGSGDELVEITFTGNGFLYNMVRIIVGLMMEVAQGKSSEERAMRILKGGKRLKDAKTAPPSGLYLVKVGYDDIVIR